MGAHKDVLTKLGYHVDDSHISSVSEWRAVFEGEGPNNYEQRILVSGSDGSGALVKEGEVDKSQRKKFSYKAHIKACKEWAGLVFNEYTRLQALDSGEEEEQRNEASAELAFLEGYYEKAGMWPMLEENLPEMFGMGTIAVVTEYSSRYGIVHKWHSAECILPMDVVQGRIRSVAFVSRFEWTDGKKYTLYNIHQEEQRKEVKADGKSPVVVLPGYGGTYRIKNIVFAEGSNAPLEAKDFGLVDEYTSPVRLFAVFKPFNRKLKNFNNAFGIPIYYDHQDMIAEIDELYDIKQVDTQTSRRNIFIDKAVLTYDKHGRANIPQHLYGTIVSTKGLEGRGGENKSHFITQFAPEPHMEKYSKELQAALNRFTDAVGLGTNAFKVEGGQKATARQVVSENQEKYTNLKKHLSIISREFAALNAAILSVAKENKIDTSLDPAKPIGFFVQDSIVVDDETRKEEALEEVREGLRSRESYLEEFRGLSGEELRKELERLDSSSDMDDLVGRLRRMGMESGNPDKAGGSGEPDSPDTSKTDCCGE